MELLSPAGNREALAAAISCGADADCFPVAAGFAPDLGTLPTSSRTRTGCPSSPAVTSRSTDSTAG